MTWPMIVLAIGSVGAGGFLIINDRLQDFLAPVVGVPPVSHGFVTVAGVVALVLVLAGVGLAWLMYGRSPVPAVAPRGSSRLVAARKDLYGDAFNESVLMRPGQWLTRLSVYFDNRGVDGLVNSLAALVGGTSGRWRKLQTGFVRSYALSMLAGAAVLVALLLVVRLMNGFPWLTIAGAVPLAGALVIALIPGLPADSAEADRQARNTLAKMLALGFSLLTLVVVDHHRGPVPGRRAELPVHRDLLVDPGVRRALRAGRGRHRAGPHPHVRRADAGGDPGLVARRRRLSAPGGRPRRAPPGPGTR